MIERKHCAILVPSTSGIDELCEQGLAALERAGYPVIRMIRRNHSLFDLRTALANDAIAQGFHELFWIQPDIEFRPSDVDRLRRHGHQVIGGIAPLPDGMPSAGYDSVLTPKFGAHAGIFPVEWTSLAFLYTTREVYMSLRMEASEFGGRPVQPYFMPTVSGGKLLNEEQAFCHRLRASGVMVEVDSSVCLKRISSHPVELQGFRPSIEDHAGKHGSSWTGEGIHVLMPTHNNAEDVKRGLSAVDEILMDRDWILTIVDAESTDMTVEIIRAMKLTAKSVRIECITERNRGASLHRLAEIAVELSGSYPIALIQSPTAEMLPGRLDLVEECVKHNLQAAVGDSIYIYRGAQLPFPRMADCNFDINATVLHAKLLRTNPFDKADNGICSDMLAWARWRMQKIEIATRRHTCQTLQEYPEEPELNLRLLSEIMEQKAAPVLWDSIIPVGTKHLAPGRSHFNATIASIAHYDHTLMAYRHEPSATIRTAVLTPDWQPVPSQLEDQIELPRIEEELTRFEDPRFIPTHDGLYLSFLNSSRGPNSRTRVGLVRCHMDDTYVSFDRMRKFNNHTPIEKNWLFFEHDRQMMLLYSASPHRVFNVDDSHMTMLDSAHITKPEFNWAYGEIRGGSTPVRVGDEYWTFFHSSFIPSEMLFKYRVYVMGAYAFEAKPPFRPTRITGPLMMGQIAGRHFGAAVVFPCGALLKDGKWAVSYGHNDATIKIATFDHDRLAASTRLIDP